MKVILPSSEVFDLGATETSLTIGISDFSRRVTDDFGVTTVTKRGFARQMSVRFALPFDAADGVQRRLAELSGTSARWVADDRFAWLNAEGFYKDCTLDLATPPLSFCTLTVEGLAEQEVVADPGGDPAPDGATSTLQVLEPVTLTSAMLTASTVPENDQPEWLAGMNYPQGVRVIKATTHRVYESVAPTTGDDPAGASGKWIEVGPTNRWAMFDQALGTATSAAGSIAVTVSAGIVNAVALLDVVAATVRVQAGAYDRTIAVGAGAITFLDLPASSAPVTVTIAGSGQVSAGTLLVGNRRALGITEASPTAGITDYSRKEVDDFGEVTVVQRGWSKRMTARSLIRTDALDVVANRVAAVRALPSLWMGQAGLDSLTVYGFFKGFSIEVGENVSKLSLTIEGLSKATDDRNSPFLKLAGNFDYGVPYQKGEVVQYQGSSWLYINAMPGAGNAPPDWPDTENAYWRVMARAGDKGSDGRSAVAQGSVDGATGWHSPPTADDKFLRISNDDGVTFGAPFKVAGENGANGKFVQHVFKRAATQPAKPTGAGVPAGWTDGLPEGEGLLWMSVSTQLDGALIVGWSPPARLDADEAALNALIAGVRQLAAGKSTIFVQSFPPSASDSAIGDIWINDADKNRSYRRIPGSGRLAFGGNALTFGGNYLVLPVWALVDDQRIGQALIDAASAKAIADGKIESFNQEAEPIAKAYGDLWYQPSSKTLKRWNGSGWMVVSTVGATPEQLALIADALTAAENAQATADGKIASYYQGAAPVGADEGDYWTNTSDGNKLYRLTSGVWASVRDDGIAAAISAAAGAQGTADGKVTTFSTETAPTAEGEGDLWYKPSSGDFYRWNGGSWIATADRTALKQVVIELTPTIFVDADHLGVVPAATFPIRVTPKVTRGGIDIRAGSSTTYALTPVNMGSATVDNGAGSSTKGMISIPQLDAVTNYCDLFVAVDSIAQPPKRVTVTKRLAERPAAGGAGSKVASDSALLALGVTSYTAISKVLEVTLAAGEQLVATAPLDYSLREEGSGNRSVSAVWRYAASGSTPSNDFGSAITGTSASGDRIIGGEFYPGSPGHGDFNQSKSGLSAGVYAVQLFAAISATGKTVAFSGTATLEAKP